MIEVMAMVIEVMDIVAVMNVLDVKAMLMMDIVIEAVMHVTDVIRIGH